MANKRILEDSDGLVKSATSAGAVVAALAAAVGGAVGGWIGYSALGVNHRLELPEMAPGERRTFIGQRTGMLSYYADRTAGGRPLVLIHSINAAGSAYEMKPLYMHYRSKRSVYALDLPGFGFSDRSKRTYSARLYTDAIIDLLDTQVKGGPADVVALSLGAEFVARAALERPDLVRTLTLISPSGFSQRGNEKGTSQKAGANNSADSLYNTFNFPLWSQAFYDLLATPVSIKYFLKQSFQGPVPKDLIDYDYATTHQPGAKNAPLFFVSGKLFSSDIYDDVYTRLSQPILVLYDRDNFVRFDRLDEIVQEHPNWRAERITPTKGLPHWEQPDATFEKLDGFWPK
jgi:pimeloyl-ACP methyl ester carboxylesterase